MMSLSLLIKTISVKICKLNFYNRDTRWNTCLQFRHLGVNNQ